MSKNVTVGNQDFEIPEVGQNAGYAEELTDFFVALSDALASVQGPNDISLTTSVINNNITTPSPIPGFSFSTASVRSIRAEYLVERFTTTPAQKFVENGLITGNYDGSNWTIASSFTGEAGITFSISPAGQMLYVSSDISLSGTAIGYVGSIRFKASTVSNT